MPKTETPKKQFIFTARCRDCGKDFPTMPGKQNSTQFLGITKYLYLPKCPHCGNWKRNRLVELDGKLSEELS